MSHSWVRSHLAQKGHSGSQILHKSRTGYSLSNKVQNFNRIFYVEFNPINSLPAYLKASLGSLFSCACACAINESRFVPPVRNFGSLLAKGQLPQWFSSVARNDTSELESGLGDDVMCCNLELSDLDSGDACIAKHEKMYEYTKIDINLLPTVILVGRPNVGKSALFNRLIRRREALVYNTPDDHVTRDIREVGVHPLDLEVGKWLRKHAPGIKPVIAMNKSESLCDGTGSIPYAAGEALMLGFGDPIAISAETGMGMTALYEALQPLVEDCMSKVLNNKCNQQNSDAAIHDDSQGEVEEEANMPLQLAIVGRPNVGKSTLLNTLLQEERVLVGPEVGLTRDSIRAHFQFQGRTIYLVDTAGWLHRTGKEKGPSSLSIMQSRKNLMRAHVVALVLDAEEIAKARCSMTHAEVVIARQAVEEGRGLVVIVNKMDLLRGRQNSQLFEKVMEAVPLQIQTVIPQVCGIPVVFISALEGRGRIAVLRQVISTYEKWCLRLPTAKLNRWMRKVMSIHSWKAAQPKIKYFTQVKARPPTFVAFTSGKTILSDTELRFLTKSLKEDFDLGGIPIRILQRSVPRNIASSGSKSNHYQTVSRMAERVLSDKRTVAS